MSNRFLPVGAENNCRMGQTFYRHGNQNVVQVTCMKKTHKANDLITTGQAAELLSKPARTVRSWVQRGSHKGVNLGSIRIGKNDLVSKRAIMRLKSKLESDTK